MDQYVPEISEHSPRDTIQKISVFSVRVFQIMPRGCVQKSPVIRVSLIFCFKNGLYYVLLSDIPWYRMICSGRIL